MDNPSELLSEIAALRKRLSELEAAARRELVHETVPEVADVLVCQADTERVAFFVDHVVETLLMCTVVQYPEASPWVHGILNHHGHKAPVIDLITRIFGKPHVPDTNDHIVVCETDNLRVGFVVQRIDGVYRVRRDMLHTVGGELAQAPYVLGMVDTPRGLAFLLSVSCLLQTSALPTAVGFDGNGSPMDLHRVTGTGVPPQHSVQPERSR